MDVTSTCKDETDGQDTCFKWTRVTGLFYNPNLASKEAEYRTQRLKGGLDVRLSPMRLKLRHGTKGPRQEYWVRKVVFPGEEIAGDGKKYSAEFYAVYNVFNPKGLKPDTTPVVIKSMEM